MSDNDSAGSRPCPSCRSAVLAADRFCRFCGATLAAEREPEARRNVVALFIDLVGSTTLAERFDPEVIRLVLDRYYRVCADCVAEHLGTVEKYIGDAIMAVFGVQASREDDALRAVRAGFAAVAQVRGLGAELADELGLPVELDAHCGISSGEAVVILAPGTDFRVIGDTVNTAARLESAAGSGEVLVNAEVADLVRREVELAELAPLPLRGKAEPVPAWRVVSLDRPVAPEHRTPMIGRGAERDTLVAGYLRAVSESACRLAVLFGAPGLGKSRLVREFTGAPAVRAATVLTGRCEPYGRDLTHQSVASIVDGLAADRLDLAELLGADGTGPRALRCLSALAGAVDEHPASMTEVGWALAQLCRALSRRGPLVLVWEDLQWAEPSLLDLIDELALWLRALPVLMVCVARGRPGRSGPNWTGPLIELSPLTDADSRLLACELVQASAEVSAQAVDTAVDRVAARCEGNPLFATMLVDAFAGRGPDAGQESAPPATVAAVLRAWFDTLPRAERQVLQRAAVCGRDFDPAALRAITDGGELADVDPALTALRRRGILRAEPGGRLRFAQTLMHETTTAMTAKTLRAGWHATLAGAGTATGAGPARVMYHAEAACLLLREVGPQDPRLPGLRDCAVELLGDAGSAALHREDSRAAVSLLDRALALAPPAGPERTRLTVRLADALLTAGDSDRALYAVRPEPDEQLPVRVQRAIVRLRLGLLGFDEAEVEVAALAGLVGTGDELGRCLLHQFGALVDLALGRIGAAEAGLVRALAHARRLGGGYVQDRLFGARCELAQWSPTPVADGLRLCRELLRRFDDDRLLLVPVLTTNARLLALTGAVDEARAALDTARGYATDLHAGLASTAVTQMDAVVSALAGEHETARARFTEAAAALRELGHLSPALTLELYAIREGLRTGAAVGQELAAFGDERQLDHRGRLWLDLLRARASADPAAARRALAEIRTDDPTLLGDAWFEYAAIAHAAGSAPAAADAARRAIGHYQTKGASLPVARVRSWAADAGVGECG